MWFTPMLAITRSVPYYVSSSCAIHYVTRTLQKAELNYSVQEKEALGIIFGVKKFRKMLLGSRFKIRCLTYHKSLECLTWNA